MLSKYVIVDLKNDELRSDRGMLYSPLKPGNIILLPEEGISYKTAVFKTVTITFNYIVNRHNIVYVN